VFGSVASNEFSIGTNYPNPFTATTTIPFTLANPSHVTVTVYDFAGRIVSEITNKDMEAGNQAVNFDHSGLTQGTYIYKIKVKNTNGEFSQSKIMLAL
jgi:serine protease AprX